MKAEPGSVAYGIFARFAILAILALHATADCQYQIHQWTNFEDGKLGPDSFTIGGQAGKTMRVVELSTIPGMPREFYGGESTKETGRFCLEVTAAPNEQTAGSFTTGLAAGSILERAKLANGRALFQADFFIPSEGEVPSLAVLALAPPKDEEGTTRPANIASPTDFYRFGLTLGTTPYFSYVSPDKSNAKVFQQDKELMSEIPKPGWHRFALVVTSGGDIHCYIDGRATKFSPTYDSGLQTMMVGFLLAENKRPYKCYVDNLSIQVSADPSPIPESPYYAGWKIQAGEAVLRNGAKPSAQAVRDTRWMEPAAAWTKAQKESLPLLLFFYSPNVEASDRANDMFAKNPRADKYLDTHACSRIDVNQLQGGTIARDYGVYKVPTFISIAPDGKTYKKVVVTKGDTWESIAKQLEL